MSAIDDLDFLDDDMEYDSNPPREIRCRDCLSEDVYWAEARQLGTRNGRWVLYDFRNSKRHVCNDKVLTEHRLDAFEDES